MGNYGYNESDSNIPKKENKIISYNREDDINKNKYNKRDSDDKQIPSIYFSNDNEEKIPKKQNKLETSENITYSIKPQNQNSLKSEKKNIIKEPKYIDDPSLENSEYPKNIKPEHDINKNLINQTKKSQNEYYNIPKQNYMPSTIENFQRNKIIPKGNKNIKTNDSNRLNINKMPSNLNNQFNKNNMELPYELSDTMNPKSNESNRIKPNTLNINDRNNPFNNNKNSRNEKEKEIDKFDRLNQIKGSRRLNQLSIDKSDKSKTQSEDENYNKMNYYDFPEKNNLLDVNNPYSNRDNYMKDLYNDKKNENELNPNYQETDFSDKKLIDSQKRNLILHKNSLSERYTDENKNIKSTTKKNEGYRKQISNRDISKIQPNTKDNIFDNNNKNKNKNLGLNTFRSSDRTTFSIGPQYPNNNNNNNYYNKNIYINRPQKTSNIEIDRVRIKRNSYNQIKENKNKFIKSNSINEGYNGNINNINNSPLYNSSIEDLISNRDILFDKEDNNRYPKKALSIDSFTQTENEDYENNKKQYNPQFIGNKPINNRELNPIKLLNEMDDSNNNLKKELEKNRNKFTYNFTYGNDSGNYNFNNNLHISNFNRNYNLNNPQNQNKELMKYNRINNNNNDNIRRTSPTDNYYNTFRKENNNLSPLWNNLVNENNNMRNNSLDNSIRYNNNNQFLNNSFMSMRGPLRRNVCYCQICGGCHYFYNYSCCNNCENYFYTSPNC